MDTASAVVPGDVARHRGWSAINGGRDRLCAGRGPAVAGLPGADAVNQMVNFLIDGPARAPITIVLAHGAVAGMDRQFTAFFAAGLAAAGFRVVRFEFPYMAQRPGRPANSGHRTGSQCCLKLGWR